MPYRFKMAAPSAAHPERQSKPSSLRSLPRRLYRIWWSVCTAAWSKEASSLSSASRAHLEEQRRQVSPVRGFLALRSWLVCSLPLRDRRTAALGVYSCSPWARPILSPGPAASTPRHYRYLAILERPHLGGSVDSKKWIECRWRLEHRLRACGCSPR